METFLMSSLAIFGGTIAVIMSVALLVISVQNIVAYWRDRRDSRVQQDGREYMRQLLNDAKWWFSEHPPTMNLLSHFADGVYGTDSIRDRWRQDMKAHEGVPLPIALREIPITPEGAEKIRQALDDPDYPVRAGVEMATADASVLLKAELGGESGGA